MLLPHAITDFSVSFTALAVIVVHFWMIHLSHTTVVPSSIGEGKSDGRMHVASEFEESLEVERGRIAAIQRAREGY